MNRNSGVASDSHCAPVSAAIGVQKRFACVDIIKRVLDAGTTTGNA